MVSVLCCFLKVLLREFFFELEVDWFVVFFVGLGLLFKELLVDFMGVLLLFEVLEVWEFYKWVWKIVNIVDIYFWNCYIFSVINLGFFVWGIIYDMLFFIYRDVGFYKFVLILYFWMCFWVFYLFVVFVFIKVVIFLFLMKLDGLKFECGYIGIFWYNVFELSYLFFRLDLCYFKVVYLSFEFIMKFLIDYYFVV